jgi:hypothetical protein
MIVSIVLKFQSPLQVIMVSMPIGNSKWSTAKVKIALKTYELHFRKESGSEEDDRGRRERGSEEEDGEE